MLTLIISLYISTAFCSTLPRDSETLCRCLYLNSGGYRRHWQRNNVFQSLGDVLNAYLLIYLLICFEFCIHFSVPPYVLHVTTIVLSFIKSLKLYYVKSRN